ncbi:MAG: cytochrome c nitrite reductase small subunit [Chloroflexota bacterium]
MKFPSVLLFIVVFVSLIIVAGLGMNVTNFTAYLGNNPEACNNCHVMDSVYLSWYHGSHRLWAVCNDCHTPHEFIPKYYIKALSGYNHVSAFLLGDIPVAIRAKESSKKIVQDNCIRCHENTVDAVSASHSDAGRYCYDCHRSVAHGERGITIQPAVVTDKHSILFIDK